MKKEFSMLFQKRYLYLILMAAIMITVILLAHFVFINGAQHSDGVYSDFLSGVDIYNNREELQKLYNEAVANLEENGPGGRKESYMGFEQWVEAPADYFVAVYKYLLDNDLPYDSLVPYTIDIKYTPFHYFSTYTMCIGYFIVLSCIIMGSMYQTGDVMTKMSKMVYSSGKKRTSIIDAKYGTSLIALLAFTLLSDIIMAISAASLFPNSGAKYCIMYTGTKLLTMDFFGFFILNVVSHLTMATLIYTSIYYLSVMLKNGIITLCASFVTIIIFGLFPQFSATLDKFMIMWGGFAQHFLNAEYYTEMKYIALLVPYIVGAVAMAVASRFVIKKMDFTR